MHGAKPAAPLCGGKGTHYFANDQIFAHLYHVKGTKKEPVYFHEQAVYFHEQAVYFCKQALFYKFVAGRQKK